jgi:hypothetical protein
MTEQAVSQKLTTLQEAQEKAEEAAGVIQARYPGSYVKWINTQTLRVFTKADAPLATIHLETIQ